MEMTYGGALVMPSSYAVMDEEEMMYLEGGIEWESSKVANGIDLIVTVLFAVSGVVSGVNMVREILRRNTKGAIMVLTSTALKWAGMSIASSTLTGIYSIISFVSNFTIGNGIVWAINHYDKDPSYDVIKF